MKNSRFKMTVAAAALLAGTGFAYAQGTGMKHEGGTSGGGAGMQQSSPSSEHGGAQQQMNHEMNRSTTQGMGSSEEKSPAAGSNQRTQQSTKGDKTTKGMSSEHETRGQSEHETKGQSKEMNAQGREDRNNMKTEGEGRDRNNLKTEGEGRDRSNLKTEGEGRGDRTNMNAEGRQDRSGAMRSEKGGAEGRTVGQAGAGAKLSTEQRTKITSVIRGEHVAPVNNANFSVAVGSRVPHDIAFHPLPPDVVTIYPEWRGFNYVLVRDEIVVIDPHTYEIVAVLNS